MPTIIACTEIDDIFIKSTHLWSTREVSVQKFTASSKSSGISSSSFNSGKSSTYSYVPESSAE